MIYCSIPQKSDKRQEAASLTSVLLTVCLHDSLCFSYKLRVWAHWRDTHTERRNKHRTSAAQLRDPHNLNKPTAGGLRKLLLRTRGQSTALYNFPLYLIQTRSSDYGTTVHPSYRLSWYRRVSQLDLPLLPVDAGKIMDLPDSLVSQ